MVLTRREAWGHSVRISDVENMKQVILSDEQRRLIERIDIAIERMATLPTTPTIETSIFNLRTKRGLVESGDYVVRQVNEECVSAIGKEIALWTRAYAVNLHTKRNAVAR